MGSLKRYAITVNYDKTFIRRASGCKDALNKLCQQYGWSNKVFMIDMKENEWGDFFVDKEGGINYNEHVYVEAC